MKIYFKYCSKPFEVEQVEIIYEQVEIIHEEVEIAYKKKDFVTPDLSYR